MAEPVTYSHSGRAGNGYWSIPIIAVPVALILGVAYGYILAYKFCAGVLYALLPIGLGALLGMIIGRAAKAAKCRSELCVVTVGLACGTIALYTGWVAFIYAIMNRYGGVPGTTSALQLFFSPQTVWAIIQQLNIKGTFTYKSTAPTGIFLWVIWGVEALMILGFAALIPRSKMRAWVYCENCGLWCQEKDDLARFGNPKTNEQTERLKAGDLTALAELPSYSGAQVPHIRLNNRRCDACGQTETVQIKKISYQSSEGKMTEKSEDLTPHILLDATALTALQNALVAQAAAKAAAPLVNPAVKKATTTVQKPLSAPGLDSERQE